MKKIHSRYTSALLALVMVCCTVFSLPLTASAAEVAPVEVAPEVTELIETASPRASACYPGSNYLGTFTFTGNNTGSNRTIYGNKMRFCIAHKPVDNQYVYNLYVACYRWDGVRMKDINVQNTGTTDADGYYFFVSDWFDISYGVDYHLYYNANTFAVGHEPRRLNIHAWYDVQ